MNFKWMIQWNFNSKHIYSAEWIFAFKYFLSIFWPIWSMWTPSTLLSSLWRAFLPGSSTKETLCICELNENARSTLGRTNSKMPKTLIMWSPPSHLSSLWRAFLSWELFYLALLQKRLYVFVSWMRIHVPHWAGSIQKCQKLWRAFLSGELFYLALLRKRLYVFVSWLRTHVPHWAGSIKDTKNSDWTQMNFCTQSVFICRQDHQNDFQKVEKIENDKNQQNIKKIYILNFAWKYFP